MNVHSILTAVDFRWQKLFVTNQFL